MDRKPSRSFDDVSTPGPTEIPSTPIRTLSGCLSPACSRRSTYPLMEDDDAIAAQLRTMMGCASPVSPRPALWICLLDALSAEVRLPGIVQTRDKGHLAGALADWCVSPIDDVRWTVEAWEAELGLTPVGERRDRWAIAQARVGVFIDSLLPRLFKAGLTRAVG